MKKENNSLNKSRYSRLNNSILYASLCFVLTFVFVVGLLPTPAFSFLGQNYVQPAFAQLGDDISKNIKDATEPWNVIGGISEPWKTSEEAKSKILSEYSLFAENCEDEEDLKNNSPYTEEEIQAEIDRINTLYGNGGPIAKYRTASHPDWKDINNEKEFRAAFNGNSDGDVEIEVTKGQERIVVNSRIRCKDGAKIVLKMHGCFIKRYVPGGDNSGEVFGIKNNADIKIEGISEEDERTIEHIGVRGYTSHGGSQNNNMTVYGAVIGGGFNKNGGGGFNIWGSGNIVLLNDCMVFGNRSNGLAYATNGIGGNIRIAGDSNDLYLNNSVISRGYAENPGGGIGISEGATKNNIYLSNSRIDTNFCNDEGGGIGDKGDKNRIYGDAVQGDTEHGSTICNNDSAEEGGGYCCLVADGDAKAYISGLNFIGNKTSVSGGGIGVIIGTCCITNCNFTQNKASKNGGGISVYTSEDTVYSFYSFAASIANCEITGNTADDGAGMLGCTKSGEDFSFSGKVICNENYDDDDEENDVSLAGTTISSSVSNDSFIGVHHGYREMNVTSETGVYNPRCYFSNLYDFHIEYDENKRHLVTKKGHQEKPDGPFDIEIKPIGHEVALEHPVDGLNYLSGGHDYQVYRGTASYGIMTNSDDYMSTYYYYSDGFFADDPQVYNDHLSSLSMTAEIACSRENQYLHPEMFISDLDYSTKCTNIAQFFADIGCNQQDIFLNEHYLVKPDTNSIGCAIASKQLTLYNETGEPDDSYILMPIVVRGLDYEAEWTSNFLLGDQGPHEGFSNAANKVLSNIDQYIYEHDLSSKAAEGKIKFWIMGHSRAGATSNLAGKRLTDNYGKDGNKVFCYTFEPPMCADKNNMELVNEPYTYGGTYKNIHNIINYADIVIHIPYVGMDFTRYGLTHYLPGSGEETEQGKWPTVYNLADVSDNYPVWPNYWDKESKYVEARERMLKQYTATNPYEWYGDATHSAIFSILDLAIIDDGTMKQAEVAITQAVYDLFTASFHQREDLSLRQRYTTASSRCTNSFEYSVGDILRIFMSLDPTVQSELLSEFSAITNYIGIGDIFELLFTQDLTDYYSDSESDKWDFVNNVNKKVKELLYDTRTFTEYISPEDQNKIFDDLKNVLYYVLNFVSRDWHRDSFWDMERWADLKGIPVIGTLVKSVGFILMNHYPECSLAWARAYDDYYQSADRDDTSPVKVIWEKCPDPTDPKILYNEKEYEGEVPHSLFEPEPIVIEKSNVFQLFTEGNGGDVIYYNMDKTDNPDDVADPTETYNATHYQTNIVINTDSQPSATSTNLNNVDEEQYEIYTLKAVSLRFNQFSSVRVFKIKVPYGYNVTIDSSSGTTSKIMQFRSNILLSSDPVWEGKRFSSWKVENSAGEDITNLIFSSEDEDYSNEFTGHEPVPTCNKNINTTWVKMRNYSLHFKAQYENPESELHIDIDGPRFNETLPCKIQPSFIIGDYKVSPFVDVDLTWHKDTKDGEVITGQIMEPNQTYVWEANIQLDFDKGVALPDKDKLHLFENDTEVASDHFEIEKHYDSDTPYITLYRTIKNDDVVALGFIDYVSNIQADDLSFIGSAHIYEYLESILPYKVNLTTNYGSLSVELEGDRWKIWDLQIQENLEKLFINQVCPLTSFSCNPYIPKWIDCNNIGTVTLKAHLYMANLQKANVPLTDLEPGTYYPSSGDIYKVKLTNGMGISIKYTLDGTNPTESHTAIECNDGDTVTLDWAKYSSITIKTFTPAYEDPEQPDTRWYEASEVRDYTYTFATKPVSEPHKLIIDYYDSSSYEIPESESTEITFTELDDFSFHFINFDGYEFLKWDNDPYEPGDPKIINSDNEYNHKINVSKRNSNAHVRAIYKPVISSVEIGLTQPVMLKELSTNVTSAKIIALGKEYIIEPEDIDTFITFHWIYDDGETWPDTPKMTKFREDYLASIEINHEFFKEKHWLLPAFVSVNVFNDDTGDKICSGYYSQSKSEDIKEVGSLFVNAKPPATPKAKLISIDKLPTIWNVPHGSELSSVLPETVGITAEGGMRDVATMEWNIEGCKPSYSPDIVNPQFLKIPGKAIIPEYIDNGGNSSAISTDLAIHVNVDGALRSADPTIYPDPSDTYYHNIKATLACETEGSKIYYKVKKESIEPNGRTTISDNEDYTLYTEPFDITCDDGKKLFATVSCYSEAEGYRQSLEYAYKITIDKTYRKCFEVVMPEPFEISLYDDSKIVPTLVPQDTEDNQLTFDSSDEDIVSVDLHTGEISAVGLGTCTITATTTRGSVSGSTTITVIPATFEVTGPQDDYVWHSGVDQEYTIDAEYDTFQGVYVDDSTTPLDPSNYTKEPKPVSYGLFGERPDIEKQTVVKIKASYLDTLDRKEHKFKFAFPDGYGFGKQTVRFVDCEKISIWPPLMYLSFNDQATMKVTSFVPENTDDKTVIFSSNDPNIASIDENTGLITAHETFGQCTITATTKWNHVSCTASVIVVKNVYQAVGPEDDYVWHSCIDQEFIINHGISDFRAVKLDGGRNLTKDEEFTIEADGDNTKITLLSSYLDEVERGDHYIEFIYEGGIALATNSVRFIDCEQVSLEPANLDIEVYSDAQLNTTLTPENTDDNIITLTSSNPEVASVDETGKVIAKAMGECDITATTKWGKVTGTSHINVYGLTYEFVDKPDLTYVLGSNETRTFTIAVDPSKFSGVTCDGKEVDEKNYEVNEKESAFDLLQLGEGYTVVAILPSLFESLTAGDHEISINFDDGSATVTMSIYAAEYHPVAQTGDNIPIWAYELSALLAAAVCLSGIAIRRRTKK